MVDNGLDKRLLYMFRISYRDFFSSFFCVKGDRIVSKYRETDHSFISYHFNAVFACGVVRYETPGTTTYQSVIKLEACTQSVFGRIKSAALDKLFAAVMFCAGVWMLL